MKREVAIPNFASGKRIKRCFELPKNRLEGFTITDIYYFIVEQTNTKLRKESTFDCREVEIAENIQDAIIKTYEQQGYTPEQIGMAIIMNAPKVNKTLSDNQIIISENWIDL